MCICPMGHWYCGEANVAVTAVRLLDGGMGLTGWTDERAFWVPNDPCTVWLPEWMDGQRQKDRLSA